MISYLCRKLKSVLLILMNLIIVVSCAAQNQKGIEGNWQGTFKLRFIFKIAADAEGNLTATFDSPDQTSFNIPVSKVTFMNDTLYIEMEFAGLSFVGTLDYDNAVIQGQFSQHGSSYPMELSHLKKPLEHMVPRLTESGER